MDFFNQLTRIALQSEGFVQIGRIPKFYLPSEKKPINEYDLDTWPGYMTVTKSLADGLFLNVDTATRFVNQKTVLSIIWKMEDRGDSMKKIKDYFTPNDYNPRITVLTAYNSRSYQLDGINFNLSPKTYTFEWKDGSGQVQKTNMIEYFRIKYKIDLSSKDNAQQPLLEVNIRDDTILLPPSLCHEAALPTDFVKDANKMRALHKYKISDPAQRAERIGSLMDRLAINA